MALFKCTECQREISDRAVSCPGCGAPVARKVQTIQQTGKQYKAWQMAGAVMIGLSIPSCFSGIGRIEQEPAVMAFSVVLFVVGFCVFMAARIGAWWDHA